MTYANVLYISYDASVHVGISKKNTQAYFKWILNVTRMCIISIETICFYALPCRALSYLCFLKDPLECTFASSLLTIEVKSLEFYHDCFPLIMVYMGFNSRCWTKDTGWIDYHNKELNCFESNAVMTSLTLGNNFTSASSRSSRRDWGETTTEESYLFPYILHSAQCDEYPGVR